GLLSAKNRRGESLSDGTPYGVTPWVGKVIKQ
ncbi:MAG: hypothetical protein ACI81P_000961, partial [Neolewinella sp.]